MSLRIVKQGAFDSIQDLGRYGWQHLGINPGGVMDWAAASVANSLVGNNLNEGVIEMHFPASVFQFDEDAIFALSGSDFTATLDDDEIPSNKTIVARKFSVLEFKKPVSGARCYLALHGGFLLEKWMNSYSTNLKATAGGSHGRCLLKDDKLPFKKNQVYSSILRHADHLALPWSADVTSFYNSPNIISICEGIEFKHLSDSSKDFLTSTSFNISPQSDRMGYRLDGAQLKIKDNEELVSSAVSRGTIQLFPDGQLIILMADHQTTGGYPRIAHVISADLPALAQKSSGSILQFQFVSQSKAEKLLLQQTHDLRTLHFACSLKLNEYFQRNGNH